MPLMIFFQSLKTANAILKNLTVDRAPVPMGFQKFASPVLDTFKFCQFLAKIAHGFAVDCLGKTFTPMLVELIRSDTKNARYDLIGGDPQNSPPSQNLHELTLEHRRQNETDYAIVKIRLFASLGMPTYAVVAGKMGG